MATVQTTLKVNLDEANLLIRVLEEADAARQAQSRSLSRQFNDKTSALTEGARETLRKEWQMANAEILDIRNLVRQLRGRP